MLCVDLLFDLTVSSSTWKCRPCPQFVSRKGVEPTSVVDERERDKGELASQGNHQPGAGSELAVQHSTSQANGWTRPCAALHDLGFCVVLDVLFHNGGP